MAGRQPTRVFALLAAAAMAWAAAAPTALAQSVDTTTENPRLAQSGSVGGRAGRGRKDLSGGGSARKPAGAERNRARKRVIRRSVTGRWRLQTNCNTGKFTIMLTLRQNAPTTFSGTTHTIAGRTKGTKTQLYNGRINGNRVTYSRSKSWVTNAVGTISPNWRRMSGTETGALWTCKFVAVKL
jgi:hypothetical protein